MAGDGTLGQGAFTTAEPGALSGGIHTGNGSGHHGVHLQARTGWIDAKLHTRCGMGACQGRICGAAAQVLYGWAPQPARHLLSPARLSTLASAAPDFIHEPMTKSTSKA